MTIQKNVVFCGAVLLLLSTSVMPASANECAEFGTSYNKLADEYTVIRAEIARVNRVKPVPRGDVKLCAALRTVFDHSMKLMFEAGGMRCSPQAEFDSEAKEVKWVYRYAAKGRGLYHCPR